MLTVQYRPSQNIACYCHYSIKFTKRAILWRPKNTFSFEDLNLYILARIEETWISTLLRESGFAFFASLSIHSLAMALVVGINIAVCLRLLTTNSPTAYAGLDKLYPLHWLGAGVIFLSGVALLLAYPAKALTNPVFYVKLASLTTALIIAFKIQRRLHRNNFATNRPSTKSLASLALLLWVITIFTGRFLAYTNSVLLASRFY